MNGKQARRLRKTVGFHPTQVTNYVYSNAVGTITCEQKSRKAMYKQLKNAYRKWLAM